MNICFEGIGEVAATFCMEEGAELTAGQAVTLVSGGTVGLGADGNALCGVVICAEEDGCAAVQVGGMGKVGYTGTAPAIGWNTLAVDGTGKVKTGENGMSCMVISVDAEENTAVIKL